MLGIDLGSNTLRAVEMNERFKAIKEAEFVIGAARDLSKSKEISQKAIERLKNALKELENQGFELKNAYAVATAAFRKASNTEAIFKELKQEFGVNFRLISADEEARLSVLGMKNALKNLNFMEKNLAFCDLGGASCELSFKNFSQSFDFGIISFYEKAKANFKFTQNANLSAFNTRYFLKNNTDKKLKLEFLLKDRFLKHLAFEAFKQSDEALQKLKHFQGRVVVLNSGVPTSVAALKKGIIYQNYQARLINGTFLRQNDFLHFALKLSKMSKAQADFWVGKDRSHFLIAGAFLLFALFDRQKLVVVDEGLREGVCIAAQN
ncbi:exopolyphosphatase [Campylobacter sp. MIT 12-8780]|uniref:Ppx/GppA phosphatase family protein n=1 Tax=unclassified Campylobacter TaxID=2593542 RepID=UPI00115D1D00|nr:MULTISPECIES: Ppx/GppA family phosphatase [unclassified Campylobacter]NDJ28130.1 Ppx/GppA family phosphatase [Campylobacter sp. MIT 19-121]TQR42325.1 exopolyphosphatase [Campylobacter sp. MIT 12-8780]